MAKFDPKLLRITWDPDKKAEFTVFYKKLYVQSAPKAEGSRYFFKCDDAFLKIEHMSDAKHWNWSQCKTEAEFYKEIAPEDLKFFPKLLAHSDFTTETHWVAMEYVKLKRCNEYTKLFGDCEREVMRLERKYKIGDLYPNGNWWVHNGRPLITDVGVRAG